MSRFNRPIRRTGSPTEGTGVTRTSYKTFTLRKAAAGWEFVTVVIDEDTNTVVEVTKTEPDLYAIAFAAFKVAVIKYKHSVDGTEIVAPQLSEEDRPENFNKDVNLAIGAVKSAPPPDTKVIGSANDVQKG